MPGPPFISGLAKNRLKGGAKGAIRKKKETPLPAKKTSPSGARKAVIAPGSGNMKNFGVFHHLLDYIWPKDLISVRQFQRSLRH